MSYRLVRPVLLLVCMTGVLFSGCTKKQNGPAPRRIAGIVFQEDQFFRLVLFGMRDAAKREGVELLEANSAGKPDKEIQLVNTYAAQGVDGIVISPLSARASISALERARSKGITVVTYNTTVESTIPAAYIESDQVDLGASPAGRPGQLLNDGSAARRLLPSWRSNHRHRSRAPSVSRASRANWPRFPACILSRNRTRGWLNRP